jgi:hypothetical protein
LRGVGGFFETWSKDDIRVNGESSIPIECTPTACVMLRNFGRARDTKRP